MRSSSLAAALALLVVVSMPSLAQQYPCFNNLPGVPNPPPDPSASATWNQLPQYADQAILRFLVGSWYTENHSPQTNQVQKITSSFESNGLYRYRDQTCGSMNMCSENQGEGLFRAVARGAGRVFVMMNFSDLRRTRQCASDDVTFTSATTMVGRTGLVSRKVQ